MHIKGDHLGIDPQARQEGARRAEEAKSVKKEHLEHTEKNADSNAKLDAIQISEAGRDLQSKALGRQVQGAQAKPDVESTDPGKKLPAHLQQIQEKLEQGFYESQEVLETVTQRLLQDLGVPAPDSQETPQED